MSRRDERVLNALQYKLTTRELELRRDMSFVNNLLRSNRVDAGPDVRRYMLNLSYTLARNRLVEARRFANLTNKTFIDTADLFVAKMEKTEDYNFGPLHLAKPIVQPLAAPSATTGLLLPPWRSCQVGANAELKSVPVESDKGNKPPPCKIPRIKTIPGNSKAPSSHSSSSGASSSKKN